MNKKVYRRNNYLIIEDSTTNDIEFSKHAENVLIEPDPNDVNLFRFSYIFNYKEIERRLVFLSLNLGQIEDQTGVNYSLNDFITFFTENTGPKYSSGSIGVKYSKIVVFDSTPLSNFNTNVFTDVPGMQITIDRDGDYTFYAALNCNNDQNEEVDFTIGLTPITNRTIDTPSGTVNVPAGTQFVSTFQAVNDTQRKKQDQTLDATFLLDNLETGDLVDFLLNTRNDNCDLSNRRAYGYTINSNV